MFFAECHGDLVAANGAQRQQKYYCPGCHSPVRLKKGPQKLPHFAHQSHGCQTFSEGETAEHLRGKQQLASWFRRSGLSVQLEAYLPALKQRPDLLVTGTSGRKLAVEFQCAPISGTRLTERTQGYWKNNYQVIWILGAPYWQAQRPSRRALKFVQYQKNWAFFLAFWRTEKQQLTVWSHLWQIDWQPLLSQKTVFSTSALLWQDVQLHEIAPLTVKRTGKMLSQQQAALFRGLRFGELKVKDLQLQFYAQRQNLFETPWWLFDAKGSPPWNHHPVTLWRLATIADLGRTKLFTEQQLTSCFKKTSDQYLLIEQPACLSAVLVRKVLRRIWRQFLLDLIKYGYLKLNGKYWQFDWDGQMVQTSTNGQVVIG